jgi:alpha-amylase
MQSNFHTPNWVKGSNVYEVNLRQYTKEGTFNAFAKELPRLKSMGVEILWFMPITPISKVKRLGQLGSYYACSHYTHTNPEYGTIKDFKQLVVHAHDLNFKVIIDWVANHTGWDHHWTVEHAEYYKKDADGNFHDKNGWEDVIDLDYSNNDLRSSMINAMKFWLEQCDIDGFRCDMAHLVPLDFWTTARTELDGVKKELFWLAETEDIVYHLAFDATYAWELLHTMEALYKGEADIRKLDSVLQKYITTFPPEAIRLTFITNHDENSHSGSEYERLGDGVKAFAVLAATWKNCMPLIYSGQELPNKKRLRFFEKDAIEWNGNYWLHDFYKTLLTLHRSHPALHAGRNAGTTTRIRTTADDKIFAFSRQVDNGQVLVILNLSSTPQVSFNVHNDKINGRYKSAFSGMEYELTNNQEFEMKAWEYLVYERMEEDNKIN